MSIGRNVAEKPDNFPGGGREVGGGISVSYFKSTFFPVNIFTIKHLFSARSILLCKRMFNIYIFNKSCK